MLSLLRQVKHTTSKGKETYFTAEAPVPQDFFFRKKIIKNGDGFRTLTRSHIVTNVVLHKKFDSFESLSDIKDALEYCWEHPELCCVYGKLVDKLDLVVPETPRKLNGIRLISKSEDGVVNFDEHSYSNLIAFDIDDVPFDGDSKDLQKVGEYVASVLTAYDRSIFPEGFGWVIKPSGSAGFKPGIRVHFFALNDSKLSKRQYQKFIQDLNKTLKEDDIVAGDFVDASIYKILSQFYLAKPALGAGLVYPFSEGYPFIMSQGRKCSIPTDMEYHVPIKGFHISSSVIKEKFSFGGFIVNDETIDDEILKRLKIVSQGSDGLAMGGHGTCRTEFIAAMHMSISALYDQEYMRNLYFLPVIEQYMRNKINDQHREFTEDEKESLLQRYYYPAWSFCAAQACATVSREVSEVSGVSIKIQPPKEGGYLDVPAREEGVFQFWKASLGTGKTWTVRQDWQAGITSQVLIISSKRSLLGVVASSFDAINYMDVDPRTLTKDELKGKNFVCCINSVHKFKDLLDGYEYVFIDEAEDVRKNIINAATFRNTEHRLATIDSLASIMLKAKYCVMADGDMTNDTIQFYMDITSGLRPADAYITKVDTHKDVTVYLHENIESIHSAILDEISNSMKVLVVGDFGDQESITLQEIIKEHCMRELPDTPPKIITIHGKLEDNHINRHILRSGNPTEFLKKSKIDALITTPVITNGVDIQGYFDVVVSIVNSQVNSPNERIQAICRERKPLAKRIHMFTSKMAETKWVGSNVIEREMRKMNVDTSSPYVKSRFQDQVRFYLERSKYRFYMVNDLIEKGATVELYNHIKGDEDYAALKKQVREKVKLIKCEQLSLIEAKATIKSKTMLGGDTLEELLTPRDGKLVVEGIRAIFSDDKYANIPVGTLAYEHKALSRYAKARAYLLLCSQVPKFSEELLALGKAINVSNKALELKLLIIKYHSDLMSNGLLAYFDKDRLGKTLKSIGMDVQTVKVNNFEIITGWLADMVAEDAKKLEPLFFETLDAAISEESEDSPYDL